MREIKFRVWNIDGYISLNKAIHDDVVYIQHPSSSNNSLIEINWEGVELEQFTGMHDKDRTPIYEGDIVEIQFQDGVVNMFVEYSRCSFHLSGDGYWSMSGNSDMFKVIGNIHQHAHLLEQSKC